MKGKKKVIIYFVIILLIILLLGYILFGINKNNFNTENAKDRALEFAYAVNYEYDKPEKIYEYLSENFKSKMSEKEFIKAFNKERSYPYLTPLFINFSRIEWLEDNEQGLVFFSQAARLPGMVYTVRLIYENGDYYIMAFENFLDNSYLEKFKNLSYSLDSYYDFED